jgi:hypothetical protein
MASSFLTSLLGRWPFRQLIARPVRRQLEAFDRATAAPRDVQEAVLRRILAAQAETAFGRDRGLRGVNTVDAFRRRVPVQRYDDLEPYLARCRRGETQALLSERQVHMYAMTSGTTAARKYIPVTPQYLTDYKRGWNIWGLKVYRDHPEVRFRPIVQMSGDWDEFRTEDGTPCGSLTGLTARTQKRVVRWLYCVPAAAGTIGDVRAKYYTALRLSLGRHVGMLIAANPSTLVNLARTGDQEKERLLRDLHDGTLDPRFDIPAGVRAALKGRLKPRPERARELHAIVEKSGTLYPKDYWGPGRFLIGTWTGGSMAGYLRHFPRYFGDAPIRDIGLVASEGRMTIPFADHTAGGILDVTSHYFEFIPEEEGDRPNPVVLGAHEVQEGRRYFILLTTAYGLYRYHIYDLVQVTGFHHGTPVIEFLSKGSHIANVTGEKLSEYQVTKAMTSLTKQLDLTLTAYSAAPCWDDDRPYYGLFLERGDLRDDEQGRQLAAGLDRALAEANTEYESKRTSRRLGEVRVVLLPPGAWQEWDRARLARTGGTLEQYKHPCLIPDLKFREGITVERELRADATTCKS